MTAATIRVWAPTAREASLVTADGDVVSLQPGHGGWWQAESALPDGTRYGFRLDGATQVLPDPRSAHQPVGVHGWSQVVDHAAFGWTDAGWRGVPLAGAVLYELHIGTFTPEGTFDAAVAHLPQLRALGVSAVELLPCAAFSGEHGWGYDGVALFAVHEPYGGPDGLKRFVDAAHRCGLGVVMDMVPNHLGPDGNQLPLFGPYFTETHTTPWGPAVNLDAAGSDEVRRFLCDAALNWLAHYHCDGLRLDAVHALADSTARGFLEQLTDEVRTLAAQTGKPLFCVAESDLNDPRLIRAPEAGGLGLDAMWSDDIHHALHAALTGERQGYYVDFGPLPVLAKALRSGLVHDGSFSTFRGRHHGRPLGSLPGHRLVGCLQNHDQVGNRARGERLASLVDDGRLKVGAALLLTSAVTPLLFMGEEWGARTPWLFFAGFPNDELAAAVREGRRAEFASHGWSPGDVPDPIDPATWRRSQLDWTEAESDRGRALRDWYATLLRLRREEPDLADGRLDRVAVTTFGETLLMRRGRIVLACSLGDAPSEVELPGMAGEVLAASDPAIAVVDRRVGLPGPAAVVLRLAGPAPLPPGR